MGNRVLHLCSYYIGSKLYKNLFYSLDKKHINQFIIVPVRNKDHLHINEVELQHGEYFFFRSWFWYHRILYIRKINKAYNLIVTLKNDFNYEIIHAHTWFSDGGIAWLLNKKYNKPYIITVRNTDLNVFYKKRILLKKIGHKILKGASRIIFISPGYYHQLLEILPKKIRVEVENKAAVIPNGIDDFWFENKFERTALPMKDDKFNLIFVGDINRNKNIRNCVNSFLKLKDLNMNVSFTLVGFKNRSNYEKRIINEFKEIDQLKFVDLITDKKELIKFYRNAHLFLMPSFTETFGLTYIEAMSQSLPVIYSKGQGIDGYFENGTVGFAVNPKSINEIASAIQGIYNDYSKFLKTEDSYLNQFLWEGIAKKYIELYNQVTSNN